MQTITVQFMHESLAHRNLIAKFVLDNGVGID